MTENFQQILDFMHSIEKLKSTLRWNKTSAARRESSAEHSWRLAMLCMLVAKDLGIKIDESQLIKMALIHDLAEAVTGDINHKEQIEKGITREMKHKIEKDAMEEILSTLPPKLAADFYDAWNSFENQDTPEAKLANSLDKLETTIQQVEMGGQQYPKTEPDVSLIAQYPDKILKANPELLGFVRLIKKELKQEYNKVGIPWKEEYDV